MRPLLLAAIALATPLLHGCAATCSTEGLTASLAALPDASPDASAAMLAGACKNDEALQGWLSNPTQPPSKAAWAAVCPDIPLESLDSAPFLHNRRTAFQACDVAESGLTDEAGWLAASGHPGLALATLARLKADDKVDDATALAVSRAILGPATLTVPPADAPTVTVDSPADPGTATITIDEEGLLVGETRLAWKQLDQARPHGPDGRQVPALTQAAAGLDRIVLSAPAKLDPARLDRVLPSLAATGKPVTLLTVALGDGQLDRPHGFVLPTPAEPPTLTARPGPGPGWTLYDGDVARPPVDGCTAPGPTLCDPDALVPALQAAGSPVAVGLGAVEDLQGLVALNQQVGHPVSLDTRLAPCLHAPPGMVCIPGGPTLAGDADSFPGDGPAVVHESTLYADVTEATVAEYRACVNDGACPEVKTAAPDDHPMTGLSFIEARFYCTHQGKRLPTQWEFERMAIAPREPTCERINHSGCGGALRAADQGEVNAWGLKNVLGNAREATSSYPRIRTETCGEACQGWDPLGFCDGAPYCKGRLTRVFKGGSAKAPLPEASPTAFQVERKKRSIADLGVRCVADTPILNTFPPAWVQKPPPAPEAPGPLSADELAILDAIEEDRIDEIPECTDGRRGHSQVDCKDPTHYIYPNEDRGYITYPYIRNRGGALLGVGSDQNYTFAAIARSELVFLLDYDAIVVHIHRVNQAFIKHEDTPDGFVERWNPENRAESLEIIAKEWEGDPMMAVYQRTLRSLNNIMYRHYKRTRAPSETGSGATSWLRDEAKYAYVKDLWEKGRIRTLKGDMLGPNAMTGVGKALAELGVPMRIYYTSNAPNAWGGHLTPEYKRNSLSFPMDEQSVVLQALGWANEFGQTGHWHFNVQDGLEFQRKLRLDGYDKLWQITRPYRATDDVDLTLTDLPGTWEDAHPE